jgi:hypothetical protein
VQTAPDSGFGGLNAPRMLVAGCSDPEIDPFDTAAGHRVHLRFASPVASDENLVIRPFQGLRACGTAMSESQACDQAPDVSVLPGQLLTEVLIDGREHAIPRASVRLIDSVLGQDAPSSDGGIFRVSEVSVVSR